MVRLADGRQDGASPRIPTADAQWTAFVRCWRDLMSRWCRSCGVMVQPDEPFYPSHYHGNYFD